MHQEPLNDATPIKQKNVTYLASPTTNSVTNLSLVKSTTGKSLAQTQTSKTSKLSKGTISSLSFKVNLCCGVLELDCMRLLSLTSLLINIAAFIIVAGVTINMFNITNQPYSRAMIARGDALNANELMIDIVRIGALSKSNTNVKLWYTYRDEMVDALDRLFANLDYSNTNVTFLNQFNNASRRGEDMYMLPRMEEIIQNLEKENYDRALYLYKDTNYLTLTAQWYKQQSTLFNAIKTNGRGKDDLVYNASTTNLVVVGVSLAIVIPLIVGMTLMNIRRDSAVSETLSNSHTIQLIDTMNHPVWKKYFKQACMTENLTQQFLLLQEITKFNNIREEDELIIQAQFIYHEFLKDKTKHQFKFVTKSLVASIQKDLEDSTSSKSLFKASMFRELEACVCDELIKVHRKFKKTIKNL